MCSSDLTHHYYLLFLCSLNHGLDLLLISEGTLKTLMTPKLRLYFEERLEAMVTRILRERGLELHSRDPLPSGSNPSSVEGYAHGSFSMLHTHLYLFTLMLSVILQ